MEHGRRSFARSAIVLFLVAFTSCHALEDDERNWKSPLTDSDRSISVIHVATAIDQFQIAENATKPNVLSRIKRKSGRRHRGSKREKGHRPDTSVQKAGLFDVLKKNALKVIANTGRLFGKEIVNQVENAGPRELLCGFLTFLDLKSAHPLLDKFIKFVKCYCKHNGNIIAMLADAGGRRKRSDDTAKVCLPFGLGKKDIVWAFSENVSNTENIVKSAIASTVSDVICNYLNVIYLDISEDEDELLTLLDAAGSQVCEVNSACPVDEDEEDEEEDDPGVRNEATTSVATTTTFYPLLLLVSSLYVMT